MSPKIFAIRVAAAIVGFAIGNKLYSMYSASTKPATAQSVGTIAA